MKRRTSKSSPESSAKQRVLESSIESTPKRRAAEPARRSPKRCDAEPVRSPAKRGHLGAYEELDEEVHVEELTRELGKAARGGELVREHADEARRRAHEGPVKESRRRAREALG